MGNVIAFPGKIDKIARGRASSNEARTSRTAEDQLLLALRLLEEVRGLLSPLEVGEKGDT